MKMEVWIIDTRSRKKVIGIISRAERKEMPLKKNGWQFNWRLLFNAEESEYYKLTLEDTPYQIEGIIMISLMNEEMVYLNNIEVAPHNLGTEGKYENVAGILLAYACIQAFEQGIGTYRGYLAFESKTKLILLYQNKYGATQAMGQKMFFDQRAGINLINKYINS